MTQALPPGQTPPVEELPTMGLLDHLEELRQRLLRSVVVLLVAFLACWPFADRIYDFLAEPIHQVQAQMQRQAEERRAETGEGEGEGRSPAAPATPEVKLIYTKVTEPFMAYLKVAALAAVFLASPFILSQAWGFVAPGLYQRERRLAGPFIFFGSVLFMAGGAFAYYVAFPFAVQYLIRVGQRFDGLLSVSSYLSFLMTVILGLGLMFELPTVIFFFSRLGLVTPRFLLRHFRWAVLIIFVVAALITPTPDIFNLCIFALPTLVLYLLGIGVAALFGPGDRGAPVEPPS